MILGKFKLGISMRIPTSLSEHSPLQLVSYNTTVTTFFMPFFQCTFLEIWINNTIAISYKSNCQCVRINNKSLYSSNVT